MKMAKGKQAKLLPSRAAMNDLAKSDRTIVDYAKKTPMGLAVSTPAVIQNMRMKGR